MSYPSTSATIAASFTDGDRDMRFLSLVVTMSLLPMVSIAAERLQCDYSTADISNWPNSKMVGHGKGIVESGDNSFKAIRPDGTYSVSPILTSSKDGMIFLDDKTKIFAASINKDDFAISDRIAKKTEQWANCKSIIQPHSGGASSANWKYRKLTKNEIAAIEEAVKDQLKDPESARFKHSMYVANGKGEYCGLVNSKNSYGGYVGDTPFMVMLINNGRPKAGFIGIGGDDAVTQATIRLCHESGYFQ